MRDLEIAKQRMHEKSFSLVVAKDGKIVFETKLPGISGFLGVIEEFGRKDLRGSSVADKVVGRAAAMLCVYCGIKAVYAAILSKGGKEVLEENGVTLEFENLVSNILNQRKTDACPFEKAVATTSDAEKAYEKLRLCMEKNPAKHGS